MRNKKIAIGFLIGASVGAIAALLFSTDKGSETRQRIIDKTIALGTSLQDCVVDFVKGSKKTAENGASAVSKMNFNTMG